MEQKFKVGDVVMLKSGGPIMTISQLKMTVPFKRGDVATYTGKVQCAWFKNDEQNFEVFSQDTLEIAEKTGSIKSSF